MGTSIQRVAGERFSEFAPRIAALERGIRYPLGADRFEIRHGQDYFAFFRRLGELEYFVALEGETIVGVLAAVLRTLPSACGTKPVWYLCDLKAFPGAQRGVARELFAAFDRMLAETDRPRDTYAVSMNGAGGENRLARVMNRWFSSPPTIAGKLELYSLPADEMRRVAPLLETHGPIRYRSLAGIKDIVLESTGQPMPLLHVQHGALRGDGSSETMDGAVHMFCLLETDVRNLELRRSRISPSATATLFVRFPTDIDFRCVRTSDI